MGTVMTELERGRLVLDQPGKTTVLRPFVNTRFLRVSGDYGGRPECRQSLGMLDGYPPE